jgi:hypothetical protein
MSIPFLHWQNDYLYAESRQNENDFLRENEDFFGLGGLAGQPTRISHQLSAAEADPGMSIALRLVGRLDVLLGTPAAPSGRALLMHSGTGAESEDYFK